MLKRRNFRGINRIVCVSACIVLLLLNVCCESSDPDVNEESKTREIETEDKIELHEITYQMYSGKNMLESVYIDSNIERIEYGAFRDCDSLKEINVSEDNKFFASVNGVLYDKNLTMIYAYPKRKADKHYELPKTCSVVLNYAFYESKFECITLSDDIYEICGNAFDNCDDLLCIDIPVSTNIIAWNAFVDCDKLCSINVDEHNMYYCDVDGVLYNSTRTSLVCFPKGLDKENYTVIDSCMYISPYAFFNNGNIKKIFAPESLSQIRDYAFYGCYDVTFCCGNRTVDIDSNIYSGCPINVKYGG